MTDTIKLSKHKYYVEVELHCGELTLEQLEALGGDIIALSHNYKAYPPKVAIKQDPKYDSFGNLWE